MLKELCRDSNSATRTPQNFVQEFFFAKIKGGGGVSGQESGLSKSTVCKDIHTD